MATTTTVDPEAGQSGAGGALGSGGGTAQSGGGAAQSGGGTTQTGGGAAVGGGGAEATGGGASGVGGGGTPSTTRVDNPYVGAVGYLNDDWASKVRAEADTQSPALSAKMRTVAAQPTFVWFDRIGAIAGSSTVRGLRAHLDAALAQQATLGHQVVFQMVVYNLPNRDCNALASNGELAISSNGIARYKGEYIDPMVAILRDPAYATLRVVALIEVDSLPNLITNASVPKCREAAGPGGYVEGVTYALDQLATVPNVYSYVDIGHSGWLGWDNNRSASATLLAQVVTGTKQGWNSVAGFASNSANYTPLQEPNLLDAQLSVGGQPLRSAGFYQWNPYFDELGYATAMRASFVQAGAPARLGMLIDTGRNGWGGAQRPSTASGSSPDQMANSGRVDRRSHRGNWCNQAIAGVGERPTAAPKTGIHAYVWVKPPGESDGIATPTNGPNAEGKQHDPMCDPAYVGSQQSNGGNLTGALANAPHAGEWFSAHFRVLVENAYPSL